MRSIIYYLKHPKEVFDRIIMICPGVFSDSSFLKIKYYLRFGRRLNLKNPQRFSEKIQWLKLHNRDKKFTQMVDKAAAKDYVSSIIGSDYIIPTYGVWDTFDEIQFDSLPNEFVLKTTNGGGGGNDVVICTDKKRLDLDKIKIPLSQSLNNNIYKTLREWPYKDVKARFIVEKYIETSGTELLDYKFFCFNNVPKYCQVLSGRKDVECSDFFDMEWNHQPFHEPREFPFSQNNLIKPINFDNMFGLASKLASDINSPFVRIDFYNIQGKIYFGEITFFPTSGLGGFSPSEWDLKFGNLIKLPL